MSERLEQWKAREKIRADVGWMAVWVGVWGALAVVLEILGVLGVPNLRGVSFFQLQPPWELAACAIFGLACLTLAVGLWNTKSWARWITAGLCAVYLVGAGIALVRDHDVPLLAVFPGFAFVYLLLPSTGKRFARAQGVPSGPSRA